MPARNFQCLVLDANMITALAELTLPENPAECRSIVASSARACWNRLSASNETSYREVGYCSILSLPYLYMILTSDANSGAMEDLHPLDRGF